MEKTAANTINGININIKNGDLTAETADCLVVPEFNSCSSRGGVGAAIEDAGMAEGLDAYDAIVKKQPREFGDAILTPSGRAGVQLAHVVTAGADDNNQFRVVNTAMYKALVAANAHGLKTIALPELGTGIIGSLTQEQSAKAIFNAVYRFSQECPSSSINGVSFVVFRGSTEPAQKVLDSKSYVDSTAPQKGKKPFSLSAFARGLQHMINRR